MDQYIMSRTILPCGRVVFHFHLVQLLLCQDQLDISGLHGSGGVCLDDSSSIDYLVARENSNTYKIIKQWQ